VLGYVLLVLSTLGVAAYFLVAGLVGGRILRRGEMASGTVVAKRSSFHDGHLVWAEYLEPEGVVRGCGRASREFYESVAVGDQVGVRYIPRWWTRTRGHLRSYEWMADPGPGC
jgi:hypothetical protein